MCSGAVTFFWGCDAPEIRGLNLFFFWRRIRNPPKSEAVARKSIVKGSFALRAAVSDGSLVTTTVDYRFCVFGLGRRQPTAVKTTFGSRRQPTASLVGKAIPLLHTRENASGLNESRSCYYDERAWINREIRQRAKSSLVTTKLCVCLLRVEEKQFQAYRKQSKYTIL